jgi:hypothetical protein
VRRPRSILAAVIAILLLLSLGLPHVALRQQAGYDRSLLLTAAYFVDVQPGAFGTAVNVPMLAFGFNTAYLGLALHELGLALGLVTFWVLAAEDINRWLWRMMVVGGWVLTASAPLVVLGWLLIDRAGVPVLLGIAWLPALLGGVALVVTSYRSRARIDRSWYVTGPELL